MCCDLPRTLNCPGPGPAHALIEQNLIIENWGYSPIRFKLLVNNKLLIFWAIGP